jgi:hypothetical protein
MGCAEHVLLAPRGSVLLLVGIGVPFPFAVNREEGVVVHDGVLVAEVRVRGPLALYAAGFAAALAAEGSLPGSVHLQVQLMSQLSWWLDARDWGSMG